MSLHPCIMSSALLLQVVDTGLNESKRFMQYMVATLVLLYFALVKLMYKHEPDSEWVRRPRPRLPGQLADLRAQLGDKDLTAGANSGCQQGHALHQYPAYPLHHSRYWLSQCAACTHALEAWGSCHIAPPAPSLCDTLQLWNPAHKPVQGPAVQVHC
eukprot:GHUV01026805.1.p1 GENE.GHUV01026805.1~~GHUV01026805.1.p1  ORF type:complete len:157 (+),score=34.53 GHUV01026805.1:218-688(+)